MSSLIEFDDQGNIFPATVHRLTIEEFDQFFVTLDDTIHRRQLFNTYRAYLAELQKIIAQPFFQLIGGSFVTRKQGHRT